MRESRHFERSALIVVDMQNDFVRAGGALEVPTARATIPPHLDLIGAFHARGRPVVYTKFLSTQQPSLLWNWSPTCEPPIKCCWKGHDRHYPDLGAARDCADVIDEIYPEPSDLIIEKFGYGAFHGTPLADLLHGRQVDTLVVTGTVTQICVEETAREAFHHGFRTTVVSDAVSSFDDELHAATLKNFAMKFGWVEPSAAVLEAVG